MKTSHCSAAYFLAVQLLMPLVVRAAAPTTETLNPTTITTNSAILQGSANPGGLATSDWDQWGLTTSHGNTTTPQSPGAGNSAVAVPAPLPIALGVTGYGPDVTFSTTLTPTNLVVTNLSTDDVLGAIACGGIITFACDGVLTLSGPIDVTNDVILDANSHAVTLSGGNTNRIFNVAPGVTLRLTNLTLANGRALNGGAIRNEGTVIASACWFTNNLALGGDGVNGTNGANGVNSPTAALVTPGSPGQDGSNGEDADGGAIFSLGTLKLFNCRFENNSARAGRGGHGGTGGTGGRLGVSGGGRDGGNGGAAGSPGQARGGAIASLGSLVIEGCVFSQLTAVGGAGGNGGTGGERGYPIPIPGYTGTNGLCRPATAGGAAQGGAIFSSGGNGLSNSVFSANSATGGSGGTGGAGYSSQGLNNQHSETGGSATGGGVCLLANAVISACTFTSNKVTGGAGGRAVDFSATIAGPGGRGWGGAVQAGTNAAIRDCALIGNQAQGGHGGTYYGPTGSCGDGGPAFGGAINVLDSAALINCTLYGNLTSGGIGPAANNSSYNGRGGHAFAGALFSAGGLALTNVTCHSNAAVGGASLHAGTYLGPRPAGNSYGGTIANTGSVFQIVNSILAGGNSNNAWGTFVDLGHNLSSDATPVWTAGTSVNNTDPMLSPPDANGGPTWTVALRLGSPAIGAADCTAAPTTDQRGVARLAGSGCDIGAYEITATVALQIWQESVNTNVIRHAAEMGRAYRLERSTNFTDWIPVQTNTSPAGGWLEFHVPATGSPGFYRVVTQ